MEVYQNRMVDSKKGRDLSPPTTFSWVIRTSSDQGYPCEGAYHKSFYYKASLFHVFIGCVQHLPWRIDHSMPARGERSFVFPDKAEYHHIA